MQSVGIIFVYPHHQHIFLQNAGCQVTQIGNTTTVFDFITVAANNNGTITDMGLLGQTGPTTFAGLRFDTTANTWQISPRVYANGVDIVTPVSSNVSRTGSSSTTSVSRQANSTVTQATITQAPITQSTVTQSTGQTGQGKKMAQTPVVIATPPAVQTITVTNP